MTKPHIDLLLARTLKAGRTVLAAVTVLAALDASALACTGIQLTTKDGSVVNGRTVEFGVQIDTSVVLVPRGHSFTGATPAGGGLKYAAKYAAVGTIAYSDVKLLDGVNEAGLAAGAFYFPTFAGYTPVTADNQSWGLSPVEFPNWILTQFASVAEVRKAVESGDVLIAPTVSQGWGAVPPPFHYVVHDKTGASIVIEPVGGKLVVHENPLGVMTNSPTFDWHMTNLRNYISLSDSSVAEKKLGSVTLQALGQGNGLMGLPGDFSPPSRFVRAAFFSAAAIPSDDAAKGIEQVFHILNNFDIPVGVARSPDGKAGTSDYTQMTMARDLKNLRYYFKTYTDQTIRMIDMRSLDLNAKDVRRLDTASGQPIVDMTTKLK